MLDNQAPREIKVQFKHAKGTPLASDEFWLSLKSEETIHFIEKMAYDALKAENEFLREFDIGLAKQNHIMRKALDSISKNSCCDACQEAKLVALRALGDPTESAPREESK